AFASCRPSSDVAQPAGTQSVTDDLGRTIIVPLKIDRAISLAPSVTEMIFAAGAGDRLVGVTTYCNYPGEALAIEKVGDTQTPNIETIIALRPQVVFVSAASQLQAFSKTLEEQRIAVYVMNPTTIDQLLDALVYLGDILGTSESARRNADNLRKRISVVMNKSVQQDPGTTAADIVQPGVFIQISNEPLFTVGRDSFLTEVVFVAGGISVTRDVPSGYPKLSKETAAALNPDVIFLSDSEDNSETNAAFKDSGAVKNGRVYRIHPDILSRPGPRLVDAVEQIAERLREGK
ncbi:MAG TPA: cobalamin-binding protein, partial [Pyrinomonadaceae bacterium]|nr:cobalamin-binding protein [Pyrinomonadaceae bacterium]